MGATNTPAPGHLSESSRRLWDTIADDYELEAHHLVLLEQALAALDRANLAREQVGTELMVTSRLGERKVNPLIALERDARAQFGTLMKQLGLDVESPSSPAERRQRRGRR